MIDDPQPSSIPHRASSIVCSQLSTINYQPGGYRVQIDAQSEKRQSQNWLVRFVPIAGSLRAYRREWLRPDAIAGLTLWGVVVPMAMAMGVMAGVSPQAGLYTAIVALTAYAVFGTSRHMKVSASSTMAIMSLSVVAPLAGGDAARFASLTSMLALMVGAILIVAGIARLGFISDFLSKSVITGFVFGVALNIVIGQAPKLFGVPGGSGNFFEQLVALVSQLGQTNFWAFAVGGGSLVLILVLRWVAPRIPAGLIALTLGIVVSSYFQLSQHGVSVVGTIPAGFPLPSIPGVSLGDIGFLVAGAAGIVIIAVGESLGSARTFANKYSYELQPDQELVALGMANLGTGIFQGFAADASLSASAVADTAGGRTQLSSIVTGLLLLITVSFFTNLFRNLPNAVLAAILITSTLGLMDVKELRRFYATRKIDFWLAITALVGVITTNVLTGLVIAALLSIALVLYQASRPYMAVLGRLPRDEEVYGDIARHPGSQAIPGLLIVRFDAPLYFFNANVARSQVLQLIKAGAPPPEAVLIDLAASGDFDIATTDMLGELIANLDEMKVRLMLAQAKGSVRDALRRAGLAGKIGEGHIYMSVQLAVHDYLVDKLPLEEPAS
jgi:high affinity sulfate transporter 1